ncbi:MAG: MlaD family protein [Pseudomonadota bacterium]|nr:MlaD family protein [Pseudomonadota bacterium]
MTARKPILVGAFVLGGLIITVAAIVLFGSMHLFSRTFRIVGVFKGSVAGLNVGSPVTFRGVHIGKVQSMQVQVDVSDKTGVIPVYMVLEPDKIAWVHGRFNADANGFQNAVRAGFRAQLRSDSLVTGQLSIDFDFYPGTPVTLTHLWGKIPEIPTIPSDMQNLKDEVRDLNLRDIGDKTRLALASMQHLIDEAGGKIGPLADNLGSTLEAARGALIAVQVNSARTLENIDKLAVESRGQIAANGRDLDGLLRTAQAIAAQGETLLASLNDMTAERAPLREDLQASVRDLAASAGSLRTFTRELERNPTGTLFKKPPR